MSLYNMLFGVNPSAGILLAMLDTEHGKVPRFRDCFLDGEHIVIHTRTGGGNRDDYVDGNDYLASLDGYVRDEDDDFDCTYANFYYSVPEKFKGEVEIIRDMGGERDPAQAWQTLFAKLDSGDKNDPQVVKAMEAAKPIMEKIAEFAKSP